MQLVVMAAVMVLVEAGQGCIFGCHPTNISFPMQACGITELVYTTVCAGQCFNKDPVYISHNALVEQKTCNGDWSYEVKHIEGCPEGVTYPVARSCRCTRCNTGNAYCGDLMESYPVICPFK